MNQYRKVFIALFFIVLFFPFLNQLLKITNELENTENRKLADLPKLKLTHLDIFPAAYEKWLTDHFRLRGYCIRLFNNLNIRVFHKSPLPDIAIIGKDGWYFNASDEIKAYQGTDFFTDNELESIAKEFVYRQKYLEKKGCKFYFAVCPVKAKIYPEYLPDNIIRLSDKSAADQLIIYLKRHTDLRIIDLFEPLIIAKNYGRLYYKTDNHWNELGGLVISKHITDILRKDFPSIPDLNYEDFYFDTTIENGGNIANMLALAKEIKETDYKLKRKGGFIAHEVHKIYKPLKGFPYPWEYERNYEISNNQLPNILVIRDSYGLAVIPSFSEFFRRSVYIFDSWQYKLNEEIVLNEKPNIMLMMVLESNIKNLLNNHSIK